MKKYSLFFIFLLLIPQGISAQDIYKGRQLFGGSLYINSDALQDILINGNTKDNSGNEYWDDKKDSKTRGKARFNFRYGYFPIDAFAIGIETELSSNSYNEEDTIFMLKNSSFDMTIGPFLRYYVEIGQQPHEIGAFFLEGSYKYGRGTSEDELRLQQITPPYTFSESYKYTLSIIQARLGFSWYLSDFISHNWFTGFLLALEPSISYRWITQKDKIDTFSPEDDRTQKYQGIKLNLALNAYF